MKIAVCFSGGIKYPEHGIESLKKILPNDDVKVFIHTWNIHKRDDFLKTVHGLNCKEPDKTVITDFNFLSAYNYETLLIENYDSKQKDFEKMYESLKFKSYPTTSNGSTYGVGPISMHYSLYKSNELKKDYEKKNNFIFDKVIRMRYDSDFLGKILNLMELTSDINIPEGEDWLGGINDQFAVGTSKGIDIYSNLFNEFHNFQHLDFHPETIFRNYLESKGIDIHRFQFNVRINNGVDFRRILFGE